MTRKLCEIINPIFMENIVRGIDCQYKQLQELIGTHFVLKWKNLAKLCNIIPEDVNFGTYKKAD